MNFFRRPITASLSPNTDYKDVFCAVRSLFNPFTWQRGSAEKKVLVWFKKYFSTDFVFTSSSGRSALYLLLSYFGIGKGDEVLVQSFTCMVVPNSISYVGAMPVFVDIDKTLTMDLISLESHINKNTKAIIIQHTFGTAGQLEKLINIAKKHNLIVIEDLAHALGATYKGKHLGTFGDAAFVSFGRDKVISSVCGGAGIIKRKRKVNKNDDIAKKIYTKLITPPHTWIFQQLFHPIAFSFILPLYDVFNIGKLLLVFFQKIHVLSVPVTFSEKKGIMPRDFLYTYPNALAELLLLQLKKLDKKNKKRKEIALYYQSKLPIKNIISCYPYDEESIYLRFPVFAKDPASVIAKAKKYNILLGNWYHNVIDPIGSDYKAVYYTAGSCPNAEESAHHILNLPTNISLDEVMYVMSSLEKIV